MRPTESMVRLPTYKAVHARNPRLLDSFAVAICPGNGRCWSRLAVAQKAGLDQLVAIGGAAAFVLPKTHQRECTWKLEQTTAWHTAAYLAKPDICIARMGEVYMIHEDEERVLRAENWFSCLSAKARCWKACVRSQC